MTTTFDYLYLKILTKLEKIYMKIRKGDYPKKKKKVQVWLT